MKRTSISYLIFALLVLLWCILIVTAPFLRASDLNNPISGLLYDGFGTICHQIDGRSFHVAGEKFGVCARCASLYFGFCFSLFLLPLVARSTDRIVPPKAVLVLPASLMLADVAFTLLGVCESTMLTRTLTGGLLGMALPWFIVPPLIDSLDRVQIQIRARRSHLQPGE